MAIQTFLLSRSPLFSTDNQNSWAIKTNGQTLVKEWRQREISFFSLTLSYNSRLHPYKLVQRRILSLALCPLLTLYFEATNDTQDVAVTKGSRFIIIDDEESANLEKDKIVAVFAVPETVSETVPETDRETVRSNERRERQPCFFLFSQKRNINNTETISGGKLCLSIEKGR